MPGPIQRINFAHCVAKDLLPDKLQLGTTFYRSPSAEALLRLLKSRPRPTVLDFGPLIRENVELLSTCHCKMFIEDFHQGVSDETLRDVPEASLDAVLCWDMLNYIERTRSEALMKTIAAKMRKDGLLLMLISSGQNVPKSPLRFRLIDREHMACEVTSTETVLKAPFTSRAVHTLMDDWRPIHSLHLRNGLQEHLWAFPG